jgi:rhamnulose-1-phosphate aldolase/alcohol dehydrogenase
MSTYQFVNYLWDDNHAAALDPVGRLIYRSNLLGSDQRITNTGGGNTSAKLTETDPLTGKPVEVLWVKGSGGDLRTSKRENFSSLYQDRLLALQEIYGAAKERGPKTPVEDAMVERYLHCTFNLNPRAPSIDTPLHSFVPYKHVDHTHPNAAIAIAASKNSAELTKKIYGDEVIWTPWQRPGFDLGLQLQEICRKYPKAKGVILGQHGLINWANDDKECYELSLTLIEKAARYLAEHDKGAKTFDGAKFQSLGSAERRALLAQLLPWLRGRVSQHKRFIGTIQDDDETLAFVNSADAPRLAELGTSCPDHFLRTKIKPLYVDWNPQTGDLLMLKKKLDEGLESYRKDYLAYYEKCKRADSPKVRDANPTVVLVPGLGMIAWGKDKSESRVTAEFYGCAIQVMRGAEAADSYIALPQQEAFDIEYWLLEEAKLQRMPAEKELARQVIAVIGAGSGIGREVALRLVKEGAHVVRREHREGNHRQARSRHRRRRQRHLRLRTRRRRLGQHHAARQHPRGAQAGRPCLRRRRLHRGHGGHLRSARHGGQYSRRQMGADLRDQRHGPLSRRRRGAPAVEGAGPARQPCAHDQRQCGRLQERQRRLRHEQGRGEPSRARTRGGTRAAGPRQWRRAGDRHPGKRDVSARARHCLAGQIQNSLQRGRALR